MSRYHKSRLAKHLMTERYYGQFQLSSLPGNGDDASLPSKQDIKEGRTDRRFMKEHWFGDVTNSVSYDGFTSETYHPHFGLNNVDSSMPDTVLCYPGYTTRQFIPNPERPGTISFKAHLAHGLFFATMPIFLSYKLAHFTMGMWTTRGSTAEEHKICDYIYSKDWADVCELAQISLLDNGNLLYKMTEHELDVRRIRRIIDPRVLEPFERMCYFNTLAVGTPERSFEEALQGFEYTEEQMRMPSMGEVDSPLDYPEAEEYLDVYDRKETFTHKVTPLRFTQEGFIDEERFEFELEQWANFAAQEQKAIDSYAEWRKNREPYEKDGRWPFKSLGFWGRLKYKWIIHFSKRRRAPVEPKTRPKFRKEL